MDTAGGSIPPHRRGRLWPPVRRSHRSVRALVALSLLAAGCGRADSTAPKVEARAEVTQPASGSASTDLAVRATDTLAADLYRRLATTSGNLVFSPTSIELALAMTRDGAKGETRAQMDAVLGAPDDRGLDASLQALDLALAARSGTRRGPDRTGQVSLSLADQLWGQRGLPFEPTFLDELARNYRAALKPADFETSPETARRTINTWASDQTHGRITDLIPTGGVDTSTRLVLANTVYLKAPWDREFSTPTAQTFHLPGGATTSAPTMAGGDGGGYGQGPGWRAAEVPYLGGELSMVVIVPDDLANFEHSLDGPELATITSGLHQPLVDIQLPTFAFRRSFSLADQLSALGMPLAFTPNADFSGMTTDASLFIGRVFHQSYVAVDQHGTEAAAATAVVAEASAARLGESLVVNRPFLFAIRDRHTGAILFLGRVIDPTRAS
jgi:serpin B